MLTTSLLPVLCLLAGARSNEVIIQMFEWRFDDVAKECEEFLPAHGYTAVQLSPVHECAEISGRPWYERYQPVSYRLISRSGNEEQLKQMVETCNNHGIKVYVDIVLNHMTATLPSGTKGTGGSYPDTADKKYPDVPYGPGDFHQTCSINDWNNAWQIRNCELVGLHDLNQNSEYVRGKMVDYLNTLVDMGVAGFRVDAAKHVNVEDLANIYGRVHNLNTKWFPQGSRPFFYQEIAGNPDSDVIKPKDYTGIGAAMDFKYGFELARAFTGGNQLKWFKTFGESWGLLPWGKSVVFVDNHDTQRDGILGRQALTYKQSKQYKMATGFMLAWPHVNARVMSSYDFNDRAQGPPNNNGEISHVLRNADLSCSGGWICEHRWRQIYSMVEFSKIVGDAPVQNWWDNGNYQIAFCRGNLGCVVFNGEQGDLNIDLQTSLPAGDYCDIVTGKKVDGKCTGKTVTVRNDGKASISIPSNQDDGFLAIHTKEGSSTSVNPAGSSTSSGSSPSADSKPSRGSSTSPVKKPLLVGLMLLGRGSDNGKLVDEILSEFKSN